MHEMIVTFTATRDTVREAATEAQESANLWLTEHSGQDLNIRFMHTNTLVEANKATGGMVYTHLITLVVEQ